MGARGSTTPATSKGVIGCKWVYKVKRNADNSTRFKARLVIKGFQQIEGVDYDETYAPVPKFVTFRMLMALAAVQDFEIDQMDVVTACLHPELDKEVYMEQPEGYTKSNVMVCRLKKALYGLKQAPRIWHIHIDTFLKSLGFTPSTADSNLYIRHTGTGTGTNSKPVYLLLWVDDILICSPSRAACNDIKQQLTAKYKMKDLGAARMFVGIEIIRNRIQHTIALHQNRYITNILKLFKMHKPNV